MLSCRGLPYLTMSSTEPLVSETSSIGFTHERTSCPNTVRESTPVTDKCLHVRERCFFSIFWMVFLASFSSSHCLNEKCLLSKGSFVSFNCNPMSVTFGASGMVSCACGLPCGVWRCSTLRLTVNGNSKTHKRQLPTFSLSLLRAYYYLLGARLLILCELFRSALIFNSFSSVRMRRPLRFRKSSHDEVSAKYSPQKPPSMDIYNWTHASTSEN